MSEPDQLPAFHVPLSPTMEKAVWLSDALTAIATERARADALEAVLRRIIKYNDEMPDNDDWSALMEAARALLEKKT